MENQYYLKTQSPISLPFAPRLLIIGRISNHCTLFFCIKELFWSISIVLQMAAKVEMITANTDKMPAVKMNLTITDSMTRSR